MSEVILFYLNKQELNWIRYAFTFGRSFSSHSTLSIAFKVSWPPTNLPIKFMLKGLTCSFVFFFRKTKQECSKTKSDNRGGSRGGGRGPRPSLSFRPNWGPKGRKKFFLRPRPPPSPSPHLIWRSGSATEQFTILVLKSFFMYKWAQQMHQNVTCQTRNVFHPNDDKSET